MTSPPSLPLSMKLLKSCITCPRSFSRGRANLPPPGSAPIGCATDIIFNKLPGYELPIRIPVANTSAPPSKTCNAAENTGVSI